MKSSEQTTYQYLVGLRFTIWVNICHQLGLVKGSGGGTTEQLADTPPVINQQQQDTPNDRLAPPESEEMRAQRLLREARKLLTERLNQLNVNKTKQHSRRDRTGYAAAQTGTTLDPQNDRECHQRARFEQRIRRN